MVERSKFDIQQQRVESYQAPGPFFYPGHKAAVAAELSRLHQGISYATDRFVFEALIGATTLDTQRWPSVDANLSVGTRIAMRLAEIGRFATDTSVQVSHNHANNRLSNISTETQWLEADVRVKTSMLPAADASKLWTPYAGAGYRRLDGQHALGDQRQEFAFDADLIYGFAGIGLEWQFANTGLACNLEGMFGDITGFQVSMAVAF